MIAPRNPAFHREALGTTPIMAKMVIDAPQVSRAVPSFVLKPWQFFVAEMEGGWDEATCFLLGSSHIGFGKLLSGRGRSVFSVEAAEH